MKYSFILEIDEISKDDINELVNILSDNKIKFHVLKSDKELKENQKLKEQLKIKHDGFMASVDESCEYAEENQKYKEVIEKVKDYINDVSIHTDNYFDLNNNLWIREVELLDILKEVEHE